MLINVLIPSHSAYGQGDLDAPVKYEARDSIVADFPRQIVKLYGEAHVDYDGIEVTADFIEINLKNNEVLATYSLDSLGQPVGKPIFTSDGEESKCDLIKYNFKTKKGYIREVRAQQDEGYIHMAESKIHPNEQIHLKHGKFTTCDKDTPHYHFRLSKAVIVPDERIVTGPVYMKIGKVPTPLAAPFAFFPNTDTRKHGIIIPEFASQASYGFGLQNFGYYIPLGDNWETQINATIYSTGRFGIGNTTNYFKKYKYRGSFMVDYNQLRGYFYDSVVTNKTIIKWNHQQDVKAHPSLKFSANINFQSDNNGKTNLATNNPDVFTNQFNSSIKVSKSWKTKTLRGSATLNNSLRQNASSESYTIELPNFNFTVSQFGLGDLNPRKAGKKWYDLIKVRYNMTAINTIAAPDSIFNVNDYNQIKDYARNGVKHAAGMNANIKLFGSRFTFTPSVNYNELWNFQYENHTFDDLNNDIDTTYERGFGTSRNVDFAGNLGFSFYGLYRFKGERKTRFKHVALNTVGFTFRPDIQAGFTVDTSSVAGTVKNVYLSPFNDSKYREASNGTGNVGNITWSTTNTLKMKTRDMKDTINETDKLFNVFDAVSLRGSYNIMADSFNLSTQSLAFRTSKFLKVFNIQANATLDMYSYDTLNSRFHRFAWQENQGLGTFTGAGLTVNANFTNRNGRKAQKETQDATLDDPLASDILNDPNTVNFDIPWQLNTAYNLQYSLNMNKDSITETNYNLVQTLVLGGDFSINDKWKVKGGISLDLQQFLRKNHDAPEGYKYPFEDLVTTYNFEIWRDLHCWEAVLQFRQFGPVTKNTSTGEWTSTDILGTVTRHWQLTRWTFMFRVNIKASMFQDIKLEYNQPPFIF